MKQFRKVKGSKFAQLRYGSFDSTRVAIMLLPGKHGTRLFVDANRDRIISARDEVSGEGAVWTLPLNAEFVNNDEIESDSRNIRIRFARNVLLVGTVGFVEGAVRLNDQSVAVRRQDTNANGQFADDGDFVWLDVDRNGEWDVFTERFPFRLMTRLDGTIFSCAADERGHRFSLSEVAGTGTLSLDQDELRARGLTNINVVMFGRAGTIVHLNSTKPTADVPPDDYRPITVVADFERKKSPRSWRYEFVRHQDSSSATWTSVEENQTVTTNPLDGIKFDLILDRKATWFSPGSNIIANPSLVTRHGLRIVSAKFGKLMFEEPQARVSLTVPKSNKSVSRYSCGFT